MTITLREITKENYEEVCELEVADDQRRHLSSNVESLVDSMFHDLVPRAIYLDDKPVGFLMGGRGSDTFYISRFMIDIEFQNKGIGRVALVLAITEISQIGGIKHIEICYHPDNEIAKRMYLKMGFEEVGMDDSGDDMWAKISV